MAVELSRLVSSGDTSNKRSVCEPVCIGKPGFEKEQNLGGQDTDTGQREGGHWPDGGQNAGGQGFHGGFYVRLAVTNLRKNGKAYLPYLLTCIITVLMFYVLSAIAKNDGLNELRGVESMRSVMRAVLAVVGIFATIFLLYTNNILIKQRKKELGLYHVLGLDKGNLARMLLWESVITTVASLVAGILGGILLGKLLFLILLKLMRFSVPLAFSIEMEAVKESVLVFGAIFLVSFLRNVWQIGRTNPVDLLHGSQEGEREPKTKILPTIIGVAALAVGYYIAQATDDPLSAVINIFVAVVLVIIATYTLFMAGSIAFLKFLKRRKNYYYQTRHFTNVSGMLYRMKQNAVGMANICIMSCAVLSLISVTLSLYLGAEDMLRTRYPRECLANVYQVGTERVEKENQIVEEETDRAGVRIENRVSAHLGTFTTLWDGERMSFVDEDAATIALDQLYGIYVIPLEDYNRMEKKNVSLKNGEALFYMPDKTFGKDTFWIGETEVRVKEELHSLAAEELSTSAVTKVIWLVVDGVETVEELVGQYSAIGRDGFFYMDGFDIEGGEEARAKAWQSINARMQEEMGDAAVFWREERRESYYMSNGGYLFIGMFAGALFLVGMILIIYYKQISEGHDDRERFQIMKKVGMSQKEIRATIRSQVLMVFFLPLATAVLHIAFAFHIFSTVLRAFGLSNTMLEVSCTAGTIGVFAAFYVAVFFLTSREYYRIVR